MVREIITKKIICEENGCTGELEKITETKSNVSGPSERFRVARVAFYECDFCEQLSERTEVEEHSSWDVIPRHEDYIPYKGKLTRQELKDNAYRYTPAELCTFGEEEIISRR